METEIFYHGSTVLFDRFDLSHALECDGKMEYHLPEDAFCPIDIIKSF